MDWAPKCASWPFAPMIKSRTMASKFQINHFLQPKHEGIAWSCGCERKCLKLGLMLQVHWFRILCFVHLQCKADNLSLAGITEPLRRINQGWPHQAFNIATAVKTDCNRRLDGLWQMPRHPQYYVPFSCILCNLQKVSKNCVNVDHTKATSLESGKGPWSEAWLDYDQRKWFIFGSFLHLCFSFASWTQVPFHLDWKTLHAFMEGYIQWGTTLRTRTAETPGIITKAQCTSEPSSL